MIPDGVRVIRATTQDRKVLRNLLDRGIPPISNQPIDYSGLVVIKPWGYEFQVFNSNSCCVWLACLKSTHAISLHCHQRKQAAFVPLTGGIQLCTLGGSEPLSECIAVDKGVFHSQENNTSKDVFFLEYEWPSEKSDIVRFKDRYGRESKGYEGKSSMLTFSEAIDQLQPSDVLRLFMGEVA